MMREGDTFGDSWRRVGEHMSPSICHYRQSIHFNLVTANPGLGSPGFVLAPGRSVRPHEAGRGVYAAEPGTSMKRTTSSVVATVLDRGQTQLGWPPSPEGACAKDVLKSSPVRPLKGFPHWESDHTKLPNSTSPLMPTPPQWLVLFLLTSSLDSE